jgi:hypothetical protein
MVFLPAQKLPAVFAAWLALSVMGTLAFAAADSSAFDYREAAPASGGSIAGADSDYTVCCLAEYTVKAGRCASLPSRKSTRLITVTPFTTLRAGSIALFPVTKPAPQAAAVNGSKSTILLKLRI